ncbi:MAG: dienelactone hydrolase [Verrucomicrobia bacterium]|nr:dienelactone hydrolase [Verrucomicrobiota bacterium]MCH8511268.1 dienelactone hydrolase [Kiritimatiellia bacterium]
MVADEPGNGYDPLRVEEGTPEAVVINHVLHDPSRDREIPIRVFLPQTREPAPVILVSHGLGGALHDKAYLAPHWTARGYVVVYMQHPGSDEPVWRDVPRSQRAEAVTRAATPEQLMHRIRDVSHVLDFGKTDHDLRGRLDLERVGIAGHSFGAITAQAVGGARLGFLDFREPRIHAALMMSPSAPTVGTPEQAFGQVKIPWMLMTGTRDGSGISGETPESRLLVYPALPPGGKYELVLKDAEHMTFGDRPLGPQRRPRNPNHHRVVLALSTAFWDAELKKDAAARAWLTEGGTAAVLEADDRFRHK